MKDINACNRNARRTRGFIENAFLELMKEKHYTKISVREITEKADINRSTFYRHYLDTYDLLDKIEERVNGEVGEAIVKITRSDYVPGRHPFHVGVFQVLEKNREVFQILFSSNGDIDFIYKIATTMGDAMYEGWSSYYSGNIPKDLEMYVSYSTFGMLGVFLKNMQMGFVWDPEKMGHLAGKVTNWLDDGLRYPHKHVND